MKFFDNGRKILMRRKDFVQCYFALRPLLNDYFRGNITTADFLYDLERIYNIWFA